MSNSQYRFVTVWSVPAHREEIFDILTDPLDLPRWWPSVYLDVQRLVKTGNTYGIGDEYALFTKGWLPYTLRWSFVVTEAERPARIALTARGDFNGYGIWTLTEHDERTHVRYEWVVDAQKRLLRTLSPLLRPVFSANHRWAMARGEQSLLVEIRRRSLGATAGEAIPPPPGPTFAWLPGRRIRKGPA